MGSKLFTDKIIEYYVDNNSTFSNDDDKDRLKEKFLDDIKKEIIELEKDKIKEEAKAIQIKAEEENRIKRVKVLMYEGFFIAFLVGLIVNQFTDIIGITKGNKTNASITLLWIIALGIGTLLVYNFKYIHDVLADK
ncbi:hypothetical protein N492_11880 [Clostridium botulinum B2 267]|uniref:hypothetical protein n=1 Tax=Clostridium botulinum TaxID=1491 RepID=UPI0007DE9A16|nr:hypothetical protein [Clostridium botulinum]KEI87641.1 hypothetical protein N492_11880 [Clostridium botulinum B2 267]NFC86234.1 hypothetical protein [Clostridium botulinum]